MADAVRDVLKDARASPCRKRPGLGKGVFGCAECFVGIASGGLTDTGNYVVIVGAAYLGSGFAVAEIAGNDQRGGGR
jgi:hypothetical protein